MIDYTPRSNRPTSWPDVTPLSDDLGIDTSQLAGRSSTGDTTSEWQRQATGPDAKRRLASILLVARMPREGLPEVVEFLLDARAFYMENRQFPAPSPPERSVTTAIASGRVTRPTLDLRQY